MRRLLRRSLLGVVVSALAVGCDNRDDDKTRIAVIPKGLTHDFWKSVEAGARQAEKELGNIEIDWKGPPKEDDTNQQIKLVQTFVSSGVDGIVLAPLSDQALLSPVRLARDAGIPVVIIDSALAGEQGKDFVNYVGTDNYKAGRLAGEHMAKLTKDKQIKTVMLLRYAESSASTNDRERGFIEALKAAAPDVRLIDPPQYSGADVNSAKRASENMITGHLGKFEAIFCPNESSTRGMLLALEDRELAGKVTFVGFDTCPQMIEAARQGKLHGFVVQNPFEMGYQGVKSIVAHLNGEKVEPSIDTGAVLVTPENMDEPKIRKLIRPLTAE